MVTWMVFSCFFPTVSNWEKCNSQELEDLGYVALGFNIPNFHVAIWSHLILCRMALPVQSRWSATAEEQLVGVSSCQGETRAFHRSIGIM